MKKILSIIISTLIIIGSSISSSITSYANTTLSPESANAYFNVLYELTNKNYETNIFSPSDDDLFFEDDIGYSFNIEGTYGLAFADLIDFDNNGSSELFALYFTPEEEYVYEVYGYSNNKLSKIYSKKQTLNTGFDLTLIEKNNKTYIKDNLSIKEYLDEGGFDYGNDTKFISINNNKVNIEYLYNMNYSDGSPEYNRYKASENSPSKEISPNEANDIIKNWTGKDTIIIEQIFPVISNGSILTDLSFNDNYTTITNFLFKLLDASSPNYSFKEVSNEFTKTEYDNLTEFMYTFLQDFVRLMDYDKTNIDTSSLLEFIFNLYEYSGLEGIQSSSVEENGNHIYVSTLKLSEVQNKIKSLFGVSLNIKDGDTYDYKEYELTNTFTVKNDLVERRKVDASRGSVLFIPKIKNIYDLGSNYYLLDINEYLQFGDEVEPSLSKFYAIVEKLSNDNYHLIKLQNKQFENENAIKQYIKTVDKKVDIRSNNTTKNYVSNKFILLTSISITLVLICLILVFIKFSSKTISAFLTICLVISSVVTGIIVYVVLDNKYSQNSTNTVSSTSDISNENSLSTLGENYSNNDSNKNNTLENDPLENKDTSIDINENSNNKDNTEEENKNTIENNTELIFEEKEDVSILLDGLLNDYTYAIEIGDPKIMHKYVTYNGPCYKDYEKNIPNFYNNSITVESLNYEIRDIKREKNGDIRLSFSTSFEITNPDEKIYQEEESDFIVVKDPNSGEFLIDRLENWKITHKENI